MSKYVAQHSKLIFSLPPPPPVNWVFGRVFGRGFPQRFLAKLRKTKGIQSNSQNLCGGERGPTRMRVDDIYSE